ncbi:MAG: PqqD family protein [Pseudonocardiaceae bacterium]
MRTKTTTTRSGDYWVLVPHETAEVAVVNETGHRIFQACDGSHSCREIAQRLATGTCTDANRVLTDVVAFVAQLTKIGLLQGNSSRQ